MCFHSEGCTMDRNIHWSLAEANVATWKTQLKAFFMSLALNECLINFMSLLIACAVVQVPHRTIDHVHAQAREYLERNCRSKMSRLKKSFILILWLHMFIHQNSIKQSLKTSAMATCTSNKFLWLIFWAFLPCQGIILGVYVGSDFMQIIKKNFSLPPLKV